MGEFKYYLLCIVVFIFICFGMAYCTLKTDKWILENHGYVYVEYVDGCYKVYDKDTRVMYMYSNKSRVFTPLIDADGSPLIYK